MTGFLRQAGALVMGLWMATTATAFDIDAMTDDERAAFGAAVRAYLLENPQVIMEVVDVLERQQAEAAAANDRLMAETFANELQSDGYSFVGGNPDGDITVVEFIDYRCGFCRRAHPEVAELLSADGDIRLVIKEYPILGEQSVLASRFAIATLQLEGPEAYKAIGDALIALESNVTETSLGRLAEAFGLDPVPLIAHMGSPQVSAVIESNYALGQAMQISGTPTFVFENRMIRGYLPLTEMQGLIEELRAEG